MAKCKACGKPIKDDAKFCTECGAVVEAVEEVKDEAEKVDKKAKKAVETVAAEVKETVAETNEPFVDITSPVAPTPKPSPAPTPAPAYVPVQPPVKEVQVAESALPKKLRPMSTGKYMFMMFVMSIPVIGQLYVIICALLNGINRNRRNYCRAIIYWFLIALVFIIIVGAVGYFWAWPKYGTQIMTYINELIGQMTPAA